MFTYRYILLNFSLREKGGPEAEREGPKGTRRRQGARPRPEKNGTRSRGRRALVQRHQSLRAEGPGRQASVHPLMRHDSAVCASNPEREQVPYTDIGSASKMLRDCKVLDAQGSIKVLVMCVPLPAGQVVKVHRA